MIRGLVRPVLNQLYSLKLNLRDGFGAAYSRKRYQAEANFPKKALQDYLLLRDNPRFYFHPSRKNEIINKLPEAGQKYYLEQAKKLVEHKFDLLGSGETPLGAQINWQEDFIKKVTWNPKTHFVKVPIIRGDGSDIKLPWELARFQHLPVLGKAYWLTKDEKYPREFVELVCDFMERNPVAHGVNWACPMEVAIRAANWVAGLYFFLSSPLMTDKFLDRLLFSLWQHGSFIWNNPEDGFPRGNHYLSDLTGLYILGTVFPEFKSAENWKGVCKQALEQEMETQVWADGSDYEGSTSYHRLVTELFLAVAVLGEVNQQPFSEEYLKKLQKMLYFVLHYTKPDGSAPLIGDNDNGRLFIFSESLDFITGELPPEKRFCDHRHLLAVGGDFFSDSKLSQNGLPYREEAYWWLGNYPLPNVEEVPSCEITSRSFPHGGYYFFRKNQDYLFVNALFHHPKAPTGHFHNDRMSFELYAGDKTFLVDPGNYCYTGNPELRNYFRSTRAHNTVVINHEEQNPLLTGALFNLPQKAEIKLKNYKCTQKFDFLELKKYNPHQTPPTFHPRRFFFDKERMLFVLRDRMDGKLSSQVDIYFHFTPLNLKILQDNLAVTEEPGTNLALYVSTPGWWLEKTEGQISYAYGHKLTAPVLHYKRVAPLPVDFEILLYPFTGELDPLTLPHLLDQFHREIVSKEIDV